jgi:hypothetical protein
LIRQADILNKGERKMLITDHCIEGVLRTYSRQLQLSKMSSRLDALERSGQENRRMISEKVTLSEDAKRRLIVERLSSQALAKAY